MNTSSHHLPAQVGSSCDLDNNVANLKPHRFTLPTALHLRSFSPPLPSLLREPIAWVKNPIVLHVIRFAAACVAGIGMPALDILYEFWSNRVTSQASSAEVVHRSSNKTV